MSKIIWENIEFFERKEFDDPDHPGSGDLIDVMTVMYLVKLRRATGWPIRTHWEVGGCVDVEGTHGHSKKSFHRVKGINARNNLQRTNENNIRKILGLKKWDPPLLGVQTTIFMTFVSLIPEKLGLNSWD